MKIRLIDGWQKAYKFLSVQLGLIGAAVCTLIGLFPDAFLYAWNTIPDGLKQKIDEKWWPYVGAVFMFAAVLARLINQPKATAAVEQAAKSAWNERK